MLSENQAGAKQLMFPALRGAFPQVTRGYRAATRSNADECLPMFLC
jgi:hypothetical protein